MKCVLGDVELVHDQPNTGQLLLPRLYFRCSWKPSEECFKIMETVANGIEGIELLVPKEILQVGIRERRVTFALVFDRQVDAHQTAEQWFRHFRQQVTSIPVTHQSSLIASSTAHSLAASGSVGT